MISIDQFSDVHLTVSDIKDVIFVDGSNKLLRLTVDAGEGEDRIILSGIRKHYDPEDLIGKKCVIVSNLAPREMMGEESNGMILCASYKVDDREIVRIIKPPVDAPAGSRLS